MSVDPGVLAATVREQRGILLARPAVVHRGTYCGRGVLGDNRSAHGGGADARGYVPVEWWIMSKTPARNPIAREGEGVTELVGHGGEAFRLDEAAEACGEILFGDAADRWPLTKLLDIGGDAVRTSLGRTPEIPPIPPHVHAGVVVQGRVRPPGKLEAYFMPPVDRPPYALRLDGTLTRLGLKPRTTRAEFVSALGAFGSSDEMYGLFNEYPLEAYDGWVVRPGVLHAPGPWPTLEIQTPQDDFNLAAWQLGSRLPPGVRAREFDALVLRGLESADDFVEQLVDWPASTASDFRDRYFRRARVIEEGAWGRRHQIFFDEFYGEAVEVRAGQRWRMPGSAGAVAGVVWSGAGTVNGVPLSVDGHREFLAVPGHAVELVSRDGELLVFLIFPMRTPPPAAR